MKAFPSSPRVELSLAEKVEQARANVDIARDSLKRLRRRLAPDGRPRDFHAKLVIEGFDQREARAVAELDRLERELAEETAQ